MPDLLLELFSEEIPARMQEDAQSHIKTTLRLKVRDAGYTQPVEWDSFSTPRRIAVIARNLPAVQPGGVIELKGPKIGAPEQAIQGFLKKCGKKLEELEQRDGIYIAKTEQGGKATSDILKIIIEAILNSFPWPKSMRWGSGDTSWVRPLHSILCLFDGKVVPVEFAGIKAGNVTYGHRFLSPKAITIKNAADYEKALEKAFVIADRETRKAEILKQAEKAAAAKSLTLKQDDALLEEVAGLVEWPHVLMGSIDKQFMDLPPEVLSTVMRKHQKYFALIPSPQRGEAGRGADLGDAGDKSPMASRGCPPPNLPPQGGGNLAPHFLIVANTDKGGETIVAGNERVARARFSDARFFWDQDRRKKLEDWAEGLKDITFHAKLGTVADKTKRIKKLAVELVKYVPSPVGGGLGWGHESRDFSSDAPLPTSPLRGEELVTRAALLCKADLTTGMVGEFPELQGVMGRYYALAQGEKPEVADAVRDHYLPLGPSTPVPAPPVSVCIALADKLDTLVSMFAVGEKPTGSKDPFALRRAALGVIRIILENNIRLPLTPLLDEAPLRDIALHKAHEKLVKKTEAALAAERKVGKYLTVNESASEEIPEAAAENIAKSLLSFFHDRLIVQMKDSGIRHDVIKAVVANGDDDLVRVVARAKAVQAFLETDDGRNLLAGYKRAANIVSIEEKKDKVEYELINDHGLDKDPYSIALADALSKAIDAMKKSREAEDFQGMMHHAASLRKPIDEFFTNVLVNAPDPELRKLRLSRLAWIRAACNVIADFDKIEGEISPSLRATNGSEAIQKTGDSGLLRRASPSSQ